jgi:hypothetical protein
MNKPIASPADIAWEEYAALIRAMDENPALRLDRRHVEASLLAYARFRDIFLEEAE